ncbi:MAG: GNAT family N-acetyltransferase [Proteobacteria bacterium]|nr:GNAT family N-acetyltransferase [Pseudomonadota bacterium]
MTKSDDAQSRTVSVSVQRASPDERDRLIASLVAAFVADPFVRWMLPDATTYFHYFPQLLRHFGGGAFDQSSAYRSEDFRAAALWLPPGIKPNEEGMEAVMEEAVAAERQAEVFGVLEQVGMSHPEEAHWYLPSLGVEPVLQGKGYGAALLAHGLAVCDGAHVAAYLESSNPANIPFYEAYGYEVVGEFRAGDSPALTPMFRAAR